MSEKPNSHHKLLKIVFIINYNSIEPGEVYPRITQLPGYL